MQETQSIDELILNRGLLDIAVENIQSMSHEDYALARKNYMGASDSSILCGVNLYKTMDDLIKEKNCKYITAEEKEVGEKPVVKKGYDLEPIILNKAAEELDREVWKPVNMYKFKDTDGLSVNYDGIVQVYSELIPVEAKLVSKFGEKYYNKTVTIDYIRKQDFSKPDNIDMITHIKRCALKLGIPPYYYTQVQQEIAGINAPYGYLAVLFDESWTFKIYYVPKDQAVIDYIKQQCSMNIGKIKRDTI